MVSKRAAVGEFFAELGLPIKEDYLPADWACGAYVDENLLIVFIWDPMHTLTENGSAFEDAGDSTEPVLNDRVVGMP